MLGPKDSEERDLYIDNGGFVHVTPQDAVSGSLTFESASGTGAGCGQDPGNIPSEPSPSPSAAPEDEE